MPKDQGTISNRTETSLRDSVSHWLADVWFGNTKEGVAKARRLVNVAENSPLGLPLWANDVTNALKKGDYVDAAELAALGLLPGKTPALHISPKKFEKFDIEIAKQAKGTGSQNQGTGHYFMEPDNPSQSMYNDVFSHSRIFDKNFTEWIDEGDVYRDLLAFSNKNFAVRNPTDAADRGMGYLLKTSNEEPPKFLKDYINLRYKTKLVKPNRYDVALDVGDPNELPQYFEPLSAQPNKYRNLVGDLASTAYRPEQAVITTKDFEMPEYDMNLMKFMPGDTKFMTSLEWPTGANIANVGKSKDESMANAFKQLDDILTLNQERPIDLYSMYYREQLPDIYKDLGMSAHRYFDPESGGIDPNTGDIFSAGNYNNLVVMNDDIIEILKRTQLGAAPVGLGAMLAMDEEPKQKPKKKDKKDGK